MGDHRASIKIQMEFHGVKDSCDMWVNYAPDTSEYPLVDQRIVDFIQDVYNRGMDKWNVYLAEIEPNNAEAAERAELKRLKCKYDDIP